MDSTSIQPETMPWIQMETTMPMMPMVRQAGTRAKLNFSCRVAMGVSYRLRREVIPANSTATKKMMANREPPGMLWNRFGR